MKRLISVTVLLACLLFCQKANTPQTAAREEGSIAGMQPGTPLPDYSPGTILVKFKDAVTVHPSLSAGRAGTGIPTVDHVLARYSFHRVEKVFAHEKPNFSPQRVHAYNGQELVVPSLHNIFLFTCADSSAPVLDIITLLQQDPSVVYAEPNYLFTLGESLPASPVLSQEQLLAWLREHPLTEGGASSLAAVSPNDPLYAQQWGIAATQVPAMWDSTRGDSTQLLAILDSGVDWLHPDLKNKIWSNPGEVPGNNIDDDHNGYIDDVRGWDWIHNDNNPADDNSHGTHVAGIAAAQADNGIGIAGVNWHARILPLKVFQSSGRGDAATIAQGIMYAAAKGATVINMSFGSYSRSLTMENALAAAYPTSILVAAAGNDGWCIGPEKCSDGRPGKPFFPAAYPFVLGVQAPPNPPSGFTNYDQDGPVFSGYPELYNYELQAPGINIISTVPNNGYRVLQGTSMAAPLVSGAVSMYKKLRPQHSKELMWGNLIKSSGQYLQIFSAISITPKPDLMFTAQTVVDTIDGDGDGRLDAGETIELWFTIRNNWGQADSAMVRLDYGEYEDTSTARILIPAARVGSISPYASRTDERNPLVFRVNPLLPHNRDISFRAYVWQPGMQDTAVQQLVFTVENGVELSGLRTGTLHLTENRFYIVTSHLAVDTLIIDPGTTLRIRPNTSIYILKHLVAQGTPEKRITFTADSDAPWQHIAAVEGSPVARYCIFEKSAGSNYQGTGIAAGFAGFEDCIFRENVNIMFTGTGSYFNRCVITDNTADFQLWVEGPSFSHNLVTNNSNGQVAAVNFTGDLLTRARANAIYNNSPNDISTRDVPWGAYTLAPNYYGTINLARINSHILDFWEEPAIPILDPSQFMVVPSDSTHGHVWRVLVNGKDAQDEYLDPLGAGTHRFDVYFNRPMDTSAVPELSFGVRPPYTQNAVAANPRWSADGTVWTAFTTIQLTTGDGRNVLRVSGARDREFFPIPVEQQRFSFIIDAAGSASAEFQATAGIGKIMLEWSNPDGIRDLLGYNLYRYSRITDTTYSEPQLLTPTLLSDTLFTDFNVEPAKRYYYYYKIVRTNLSESDSSRVVSSIPLTAARGDANGDLSVNVLDITSIVGYLLNQNPQPFIFAAADVNRDNTINVLDIVGTVSIILGSNRPLAKASGGTPQISFTASGASLSGGSTLSALQITLAGKGLHDARVQPGPLSAGMELAYHISGDTLTVVLFNLTNSCFSTSLQEQLFTISSGTLLHSIAVIACTPDGNAVSVTQANDGVIIPGSYVLQQNFPNPFNPETVIRYGLPEACIAELSVYSITGELVWRQPAAMHSAGFYETAWQGTSSGGALLPSGLYIYRLSAGTASLQKKMMLIR